MELDNLIGLLGVFTVFMGMIWMVQTYRAKKAMLVKKLQDKFNDL